MRIYVTFCSNFFHVPQESIYVVGSLPELGAWSTSAAIQLQGVPDT